MTPSFPNLRTAVCRALCWWDGSRGWSHHHQVLTKLSTPSHASLRHWRAPCEHQRLSPSASWSHLQCLGHGGLSHRTRWSPRLMLFSASSHLPPTCPLQTSSWERPWQRHLCLDCIWSNLGLSHQGMRLLTSLVSDLPLILTSLPSPPLQPSLSQTGPEEAFWVLPLV